MRIGYARVSTQEQNLDLQKDALRRAGCKKIIEDVASGKTENRPGLDHARELLREGDVLVVWRLDRLRPLTQAPHRADDGAGKAENRIPEPSGIHRHDLTRRQADIPHVRSPCGI